MVKPLPLEKALVAINPAIISTPRFQEVNVLLADGLLQAWNGFTSGQAPIDHSYGPVLLNARKLVTNFTSTSKLTVAEQFATVKRGKTTVRLLKQPMDQFIMPPPIPTGKIMREEIIDAIIAASKFMSENALHLWANAVALTDRFAAATNNQILVKVPVHSPFHLTIPKWVIDAFDRNIDTYLSYSDTSIRLEYPNGVSIQAQMIEGNMPEKMFELCDTIKLATHLVGDAKSELEDISRIGGRFIEISDGVMSCTADSGERSETETDLVGTVKMAKTTLELVLSVATHMDFKDNVATFLDARTGLRGIAMGVR